MLIHLPDTLIQEISKSWFFYANETFMLEIFASNFLDAEVIFFEMHLDIWWREMLFIIQGSE